MMAKTLSLWSETVAAYFQRL